MNGKNRDLDIAKNLKMVEWLKAELVDAVGLLFKTLLKPSSEATADALTSIILLTYLLGQRVGVSFQRLDTRVKEKLLKGIQEGQGDDEWHRDITKLLRYLERKTR